MLNREFGFALRNGHGQLRLLGPKSANMRHERGPTEAASGYFIFSQTSLTMPIFLSPEKGWGGFV